MHSVSSYVFIWNLAEGFCTKDTIEYIILLKACKESWMIGN